MGRVVLGSVVLAVVALMFGAPPAHAAASELRISAGADRGNHRRLSGAGVSGDAYVFWNGPRARSVTFVIDPWRLGPEGPGYRSVERIAPYDLAHTAADGSAQPFDTGRLEPGRHLLLVIIREVDGGTTFRAATFVVESKTPVEPTPEPKPEPAPSATVVPAPTIAPSRTPDPTPSAEPTATATESASAKPTPTAEPTRTPEPTLAPSPTRTPTPEPEPTPTPTPEPTSAPPPPPSDPSGDKLVVADFDGQRTGPVSPGSFNAEVGDTNDDTGAYEGMEYVSDGRGGQAVRTKLAAGQYIGTGGSGNGNVLFVKLAKAQDSACMSYSVRFSDGFDYSLGGKLPGLQGVAPGVSASAPTGGGSTAHGWSGRLMWLGPKAYRFAGEGGNDNMAVTYLYHPGQAGTWGDNVQWHRPFRADRWHQVKQCHVLNTVGKANGSLKAWMDGALVVDQSDVVYRTDAAVRITHVNWSIFRGGNTADWAGKNDGHVDVDNLVITGS